MCNSVATQKCTCVLILYIVLHFVAKHSNPNESLGFNQVSLDNIRKAPPTRPYTSLLYQETPPIDPGTHQKRQYPQLHTRGSTNKACFFSIPNGPRQQ